MGAITKPSRIERVREKRRRRSQLRRDERLEKQDVRKRDGYRCRFPLCGCKALGLRLEVSHNTHKGMGGDPTGERSKAREMILLCWHRHQSGQLSIHKGTLEARARTPAGMNGPVAWWINLSGDKWIEIAREVRIQELELQTAAQREQLQMFARMVL